MKNGGLKMANFEFYNEYNGKTYLQLHDNHTLWEIKKGFDFDDYSDAIKWAFKEIKARYKDIEIYQLGRSGRHICIDDTPTNRRRYENIKNYTLKLEKEIIDYFNNKEVSRI